MCNSLELSLDSSCSRAGLLKAELGYTKVSENFDFSFPTFSVSVSFRLFVLQFSQTTQNINNEKYFYARKIMNISVNF